MKERGSDVQRGRRAVLGGRLIRRVADCPKTPYGGDLLLSEAVETFENLGALCWLIRLRPNAVVLAPPSAEAADPDLRLIARGAPAVRNVLVARLR